MAKKVLILMGSASDTEKLQPAADTLTQLGVEHEWWQASAHRNPAKVQELVGGARDNGFGVIIAAAGLAAHLAGACAAHTTLPVIGIPLASGPLNGADALHSTVQMPPGMPVATVAINGAKNAALLAAQILAVTDEDLQKKLEADRATWEPKQIV
jgi:5-(carboxyamino)imidazole ribonucleotide mutase